MSVKAIYEPRLQALEKVRNVAAGKICRVYRRFYS